MTLAIAERFCAKVDFGGVAAGSACWEWIGARYSSGYGVIRLDAPRRAHTGAHRVSWELHHGPIPEGLCVLHSCDNGGCVNPEHLFLGTLRDNTQDMVNKGRARGGQQPGVRAGEAHPLAKLTRVQVEEIRRVCVKEDRELGYCPLARRFGVTPNQIRRIVRGERWREGHE